jgi:thymidylate kinase
MDHVDACKKVNEVVKREGRRTIFTAFPPRRDMGRALATAGMDRARPKDAGAAVKADAEATAARRTDLRSIILRDDARPPY